MKKFIFRVLTYALVPLIIGIVILGLSGSKKIYAYAPLVAKLEYLQNHPEYNLYFIGSSKINNQINPQIIDEMIPNVHSYNLGANGGFNLENYQVLEEVLSDDAFRPKYIVLELQEKSKLTKTNLHSTRSFGMFDFNNTKYNVGYYIAEKNYKQVLLSIYSFALNVFHYDKTPNRPEVNNFTNEIVTEKSGFGSLDSTQKNRTPKKELEKEILRRLKLYSTDNENYTPNPVLVEKMQELTMLCDKKNIKLLLLIPGPAEPDAKRLDAYTTLPGIPVINLLSPKDYPEFYKYENRWDYGHLNERGANIMSINVADHLKENIR